MNKSIKFLMIILCCITSNEHCSDQDGADDKFVRSLLGKTFQNLFYPKKPKEMKSGIRKRLEQESNFPIPPTDYCQWVVETVEESSSPTRAVIIQKEPEESEQGNNLRMPLKGCCQWMTEKVKKPNDTKHYVIETFWECHRPVCDRSCVSGRCWSIPYRYDENYKKIPLLPSGEVFVETTERLDRPYQSDEFEERKRWIVPEAIKTDKKFAIEHSITAARNYIMYNRFNT